MAIGRLSMKVGAKGKATPHAAYIARTGKYQHRLETGERLVATGTGNMPGWAQSDPSSFWKAADTFERENGTTYREMEIALPRELNDEQKQRLIQEWVKQEISTRHAYQWAIHSPRASDGGEQPHAHLMFSERTMDGIEREPGQLFKRYNSKAPEKGGAKKANTGKQYAERRDELKALRHRWEVLCNRHLRAADTKQRISMKPNHPLRHGAPEPKMLPSEWSRGDAKADIIEFREARRDFLETEPNVRLFVRPTADRIETLEILKAAKEEERQEAIARQKRAEEERQKEIADRLANPYPHMAESELAALLPRIETEIRDRTEKFVQADPDYRDLAQKKDAAAKEQSVIEASIAKAEHEERKEAERAKALEDNHRFQTGLHRAGIKTFKALDDAENAQDYWKERKKTEKDKAFDLSRKLRDFNFRLDLLRDRLIEAAKRELADLRKKAEAIREALKAKKMERYAREQAERRERRQDRGKSRGR